VGREVAMERQGVPILVLAMCVPLISSTGCGRDTVETTGTNSLSVEVTELVGAQGSQLSAELAKSVDYLQKAPTWTLLTTTVTSSPFDFSDTVARLPEGEFGLFVQAGSEGKSEKDQVKGQGCEMTVQLGKDEKVSISIEGLNEFGDKGYGQCRATITR
jgi:hypothetical protein